MIGGESVQDWVRQVKVDLPCPRCYHPGYEKEKENSRRREVVLHLGGAG